MSVKSLVAAYNELTKLDLRVLRVIEVAHRRYEWVPIEIIVKWSNKPWELVSKSLKKLNALGMIIRWKGNYTGYRLTYFGYDALALHTLAKRGVIERLSPTPLGVGKESDVYVAEDPAGNKLVVKFHRLGRTSFRQTRKFRTWVGDRRHITWLYESRLSAHMEYKALVLTYNAGVHVPRPVSVNRHAVVMQYIESLRLSEIRRKLENPEDVLGTILDDIYVVYRDVGIVHGDLSEYNIIISLEDGTPYIIDWPQRVPRTYRNAQELLRRDLTIIIEFFRKEYKIEVDIDEVMKYLTEGIEAGELELDEAFEEMLGTKELREYVLGEESEESIEKALDKIESEFKETGKEELEKVHIKTMEEGGEKEREESKEEEKEESEKSETTSESSTESSEES